jgi:hypothetical protein
MAACRMSVALVLALLPGTPIVRAQSLPAAAALVRTEGEVYLNEQLVKEGAPPIALTDAAHIRTDKGRARISLKRGGTLVLGDQSSVRILANGGYNFNKVELLVGSAIVLSSESSPLVACGTDVRLSSSGVFRFDVQPPEPADGTPRCALRVFDGGAATAGPSVIYVLRGGQRMVLNRRAGDMIPVQAFPANDLDDLDRWSRQ